MTDDKSTLERTVEGYGIDRVVALGGRSIKLRGYLGIPDRLMLLPGGRILFVEFKRPVGGKYRPLQKQWIKWLSELGFVAARCNTRKMFDELLDAAMTQ